MRLSLTIGLLFTLANTPAPAADLRVPPGCEPAPGATAGVDEFADRVVHQKTGIELVLIPPGSFDMSVPKAGSYRQVPHTITIASPFYMGKTEVTNAQYRRFTEATKYDGAPDTDPAYDLYLRHWRGKSLMSSADDHPVVWVSWLNASAFCRWAGLVLPSDARWEYACRAGTTTAYYWGDDDKDFDQYGWGLYSEDHTHPVGQLKPNALGLLDLLGNVWEWARDDAIEPFIPPADGSACVGDAMTKVLRGGAWSCSNSLVNKVTWRHTSAPGNASGDLGFRVALHVE